MYKQTPTFIRFVVDFDINWFKNYVGYVRAVDKEFTAEQMLDKHIIFFLKLHAV